jgi:hypothetical protein
MLRAMTDGTIIDAALRFVRTNPDLLAAARAAAPQAGCSVDVLLDDAVRRCRSAVHPVAEQEEVSRAPHRAQLRVLQGGGRQLGAGHHARAFRGAAAGDER